MSAKMGKEEREGRGKDTGPEGSGRSSSGVYEVGEKRREMAERRKRAFLKM